MARRGGWEEREKRKKDRSRTKSKDEPKFQVSAAMIGKRGSLISRADNDHELSARREGVRKREGERGEVMEISGASTCTILVLICGARVSGLRPRCLFRFAR